VIGHSASGLEPDDFEYVRGIVSRNYIGQGPLCAELKSMLAARFGRTHVVLTDSGTAALHLSILALKQQKANRTRLLVSAYVCPEVVAAITQASLTPVLVDCLPDSLNMSMDDAARKADASILAIICTNIGGVPDEYAAAARLGVPVISDCAQSVGSMLAGRDLASEGVCSILSFHPTKMLTAGSGGALLSECELGQCAADLARTDLSVEEYRRTGFRVTFGQHVGDLTAGLAAARLRRLDANVERRRLIAASYDTALRDHKDVSLMQDSAAARSNRFRYYFLTERATAWVQHLRSSDIDARRSISHVLPEYLGNMESFPNLVRTAPRVVSVPIYPAMTPAQWAHVSNALAAGPDRDHTQQH
jgi:perosamine synthetase